MNECFQDYAPLLEIFDHDNLGAYPIRFIVKTLNEKIERWRASLVKLFRRAPNLIEELDGMNVLEQVEVVNADLHAQIFRGKLQKHALHHLSPSLGNFCVVYKLVGFTRLRPYHPGQF